MWLIRMSAEAASEWLRPGRIHRGRYTEPVDVIHDEVVNAVALTLQWHPAADRKRIGQPTPPPTWLIVPFRTTDVVYLA